MVEAKYSQYTNNWCASFEAASFQEGIDAASHFIIIAAVQLNKQFTGTGDDFHNQKRIYIRL